VVGQQLLGGSFTRNPGRIGGFALLIVRYARCLLSRVGSYAPSDHRVNLTAYGAGGMIEYTAFRSARSRGSPVSVVPIWLVTYA
jgi:hypothetical protein